MKSNVQGDGITRQSPSIEHLDVCRNPVTTSVMIGCLGGGRSCRCAALWRLSDLAI
jgi:hypothetical protein